jgi:hypothetical protein
LACFKAEIGAALKKPSQLEASVDDDLFIVSGAEGRANLDEKLKSETQVRNLPVSGYYFPFLSLPSTPLPPLPFSLQSYHFSSMTWNVSLMFAATQSSGGEDSRNRTRGRGERSEATSCLRSTLPGFDGSLP